MDEDYVLISKEHLKNLKKENKELLAEISKIKSSNLNTNYKNNNIIESKDQSKLDLILNSLNNVIDNKNNFDGYFVELFELNKKTLTTVLQKEDNLTIKLDKIILNFKDLIRIISQFTQESSRENDKLNEMVKNFNSQIPEINSNRNTSELIEKLESIEDFMNNLKKMLSQIKKIE